MEGSSEEGQEQEEEAGLPVHEEAGQPVCDGLLEEGGEVMGSTAEDNGQPRAGSRARSDFEEVVSNWEKT